MSRPPRIRELVESEEYRDQLEKLGGARGLDKHLRALLWSLAVNPHAWPLIPTFKKTRLAYTDAQITERGVTPGFRIWFEISDKGDQVYLHYLDIAEEG